MSQEHILLKHRQGALFAGYAFSFVRDDVELSIEGPRAPESAPGADAAQPGAATSEAAPAALV